MEIAARREFMESMKNIQKTTSSNIRDDDMSDSSDSEDDQTPITPQSARTPKYGFPLYVKVE